MQICKNIHGLNQFYEQTFWYYQTLERNPKLIETLLPKIKDSINWLSEHNLIKNINSKIFPTRLGTAIFSTGLLPSTGTWLLKIIQRNIVKFESPAFQLPLLHAICASDEFSEEIGQRYLPYARNNQPEQYAWITINDSETFIDPNTGSNVDRIINAAFGAYLWCNGVKEYELRDKLPSISYGQFYTLSNDIAWILEGLANIIRVPGLSIKSTIASKIEILSERIRLGVPSELVDIVKAAKMFEVPGFGRYRAMDLFEKGLADPNDLLKEKFETIQEILEEKQRAEELLNAVSKYFPTRLLSWRNQHIRRAKEQNKDHKLIIESYDLLGTEYEDSIEKILKLFEWQVKKIDSLKRQGVPDLLLSYKGQSIVIECKTKNKKNAAIDKEDAFAVLIKAADINADHFITLGKPDFSTFSKEKATGSDKITLVPHYCFIDAVIRIWEGRQNPQTIFQWLKIPGVASLNKLSTFSKGDE